MSKLSKLILYTLSILAIGDTKVRKRSGINRLNIQMYEKMWLNLRLRSSWSYTEPISISDNVPSPFVSIASKPALTNCFNSCPWGRFIVALFPEEKVSRNTCHCSYRTIHSHTIVVYYTNSPSLFYCSLSLYSSESTLIWSEPHILISKRSPF